MTATLPLYSPDDESWKDDGLCRYIDIALFFPEKGASTKEPKSVCVQCPVRMRCLEYAMERHERWGIWGGLSDRERRALRRKRGEVS